VIPRPVDRAFVRIAEGLVHYRHLAAAGDALPLVLLHAAPGSSVGLEPLLAAFGRFPEDRRVIAPDTLGHGDSAPAAPDRPDIAYYADALRRMLDAIGVDRFVLYGAHTGARIAIETAILLPGRVARVVLDGVGDYDGALRDELIAQYAPEMAPDDYGRHLIWAFNFVRDQALHFPYYSRDPAHRLMSRAVPGADALHGAVLDVLKAIRTYHKSYRAAFAYPTTARLATCHVPVTFLAAPNELPSLRAQLTVLADATPDATEQESGGAAADKAATLLRILTGER
jgi:pimeloyl-ACP methyl ester carboxylesterase